RQRAAGGGRELVAARGAGGARPVRQQAGRVAFAGGHFAQLAVPGAGWQSLQRSAAFWALEAACAAGPRPGADASAGDLWPPRPGPSGPRGPRGPGAAAAAGAGSTAVGPRTTCGGRAGAVPAAGGRTAARPRHRAGVEPRPASSSIRRGKEALVAVRPRQPGCDAALTTGLKPWRRRGRGHGSQEPAQGRAEEEQAPRDPSAAPHGPPQRAVLGRGEGRRAAALRNGGGAAGRDPEPGWFQRGPQGQLARHQGGGEAALRPKHLGGAAGGVRQRGAEAGAAEASQYPDALSGASQASCTVTDHGAGGRWLLLPAVACAAPVSLCAWPDLSRASGELEHSGPKRHCAGLPSRAGHRAPGHQVPQRAADALPGG
ncbi:unnamed protein product, partial [Effrenium voratum]